MSDLIIPNWHPLLVHFTVALVTISTVFFVLSKLVKGKAATFETVAKWTLWVGAALTVLTILAGFDAYNSVAHDDVAHKVMKVHRNYALGTGAVLLLLAIWVFRAKAVSNVIVGASLVVAGLVGATGYLGAELVYRHGLGVMRLPDTSGEGHAHAGGGGGHSHGEETPAKKEEGGHEHAEGEGHGEEAPAKTEEGGHEHAEGEGHGEEAPAKKEEEGLEHAEGEGNGEATEQKGHDHGDGGHEALATTVDPAAVSDALYAALKSGNVAAVDALLAADVLIVEGGHAQLSKADYMAGHMKSDMAFLPHTESKTLSREVGLAGDTAWVTTHSQRTGTYKGKSVDGTGREFLVMKRKKNGWKITLIQWSDK